MALRIRRGTDAERQIIIPQAGELIYTTDTKQVFVGDGSTGGGIPIGSTLASDLVLNGNNITGTGNINIDGTITATGNINLGDGVEDNVIVGGQISSNLVPSGDVAYNLGSGAQRWRNIWTAGMVVDGAITAGSITANVIAQDSTVLVNATEGTINAGALEGDIDNDIIGSKIYASDSSLLIDGELGAHYGSFFGTLTGDISGSVFSDDSSVLVDAVNASLHAGSIELSGDKITVATGTLKLGADDDSIGLRLYDNATGSKSISIFGVCAGDFETTTTGATNISVSQGTLENPSTVQDGNILYAYNFRGYDGATYPVASHFLFAVDGTPQPGGIPGKIYLANYENDGSTFHLLSFDSQGRLGVNKQNATATLDVEGDAIISGDIQAAAFKGSLMADDSTTIVDAVENKVFSTIVASTDSAPSGNDDPGDTGEIRYDNSFIYIKTASGWKKATLSSIV